jgi:hypothetical protein
MLKIVYRFGKHCSCYRQGEYVMVGHFWNPYIGQEVGRELDLMVLIGGVVCFSALPISTIKSNSLPTAHLI